MPSFDPDQFANMGATGVLIAAALVFGVIALLKGVARLISWVVAALLAIAGGYFGYQHADQVLATITDQPQPWMHYVVASTISLGLVFMVRLVFRKFFLTEGEDGKRHFGIKALLIGLGLGCFVVYSGMTSLRYADALDQLKTVQERVTGGDDEDSPTLLNRFASFIKSSDLSGVFAKLDVFTDDEKVQAAKLLLADQLEKNKYAPGSLENPIKAESVDEEELMESIRLEDFSSLLHSKAVENALSNPAFRERIAQP